MSDETRRAGRLAVVAEAANEEQAVIAEPAPLEERTDFQ
jgi:hypothetical protein